VFAVVSMVFVVAGSRLAAQTAGPRPTVVVLNLRFDGEHANVLSPGDTAVVAAATSKLLATLRASERVALVDSGAVATAVATAEPAGNPCGNECALTVARQLEVNLAYRGLQ